MTSRYSNEYSDYNCAYKQCAKQRLDKDGVLNLAQSWLLNPDFTVKDLANEISLLVLFNPGFIFETVAGRGGERIDAERSFGVVVHGRFLHIRIVISEEFIRANMLVV